MRDITTEELCKGKKIVIFAVPGAFTPTCSLKHVPGFVDKADELKTKVCRAKDLDMTETFYRKSRSLPRFRCNAKFSLVDTRSPEPIPCSRRATFCHCGILNISFRPQCSVWFTVFCLCCSCLRILLNLLYAYPLILWNTYAMFRVWIPLLACQ